MAEKGGELAIGRVVKTYVPPSPSVENVGEAAACSPPLAVLLDAPSEVDSGALVVVDSLALELELSAGVVVEDASVV